MLTKVITQFKFLYRLKMFLENDLWSIPPNLSNCENAVPCRLFRQLLTCPSADSLSSFSLFSKGSRKILFFFKMSMQIRKMVFLSVTEHWMSNGECVYRLCSAKHCYIQLLLHGCGGGLHIIIIIGVYAKYREHWILECKHALHIRVVGNKEYMCMYMLCHIRTGLLHKTRTQADQNWDIF